MTPSSSWFDGVRRLQKTMGCEVDVEWAESGDRIFWLQVRPQTGATTGKFVVPEPLRSRLKGLWVRINHSLSPQAPLVATLNPGGYMDGRTWRSCIVNGYHYVQQAPVPDVGPVGSEFESMMDAWDRLEADYDAQLQARRAVDLGDLGEAELWDELHRRIELSRRYFHAYSDPTFLASRKSLERTVRETVRRLSADESAAADTLGNLLSSLGSLTEKKKAMLRSLADDLGGVDEHAVDSKRFRQFMHEFGFEAATTQLYYLPTLAESPDLVLAMIRDGVATAPAVAANDWQQTLTSLVAQLPAGETDAFRTAVLRLRRCLLRTENDDYPLALASALVRYCLLECGARLTTMRALTTRDEVFFLTADEMREALLNAVWHDFASVVQRRRHRFKSQQRLNAPPMIMNGRPKSPGQQTDKRELHGTAASPGAAQGAVLVVRDPFRHMGKPLPPGSVIVAPVLTPALAYSLSGCAALITEVGGLASHGAIVARELGIPAVVGLQGAMQRLQTGTVVAVNGAAGTVSII